ncbi:hypothetical protein [Pukyongiella litopenaei]|uniref:Uncharacterized protein n=1 Tax=Pukyongiella litopenaei TaxID=2605946 RepID=A0A2S0MNB7_9RHOB|nr:hypothetical protein [Pukyongiella litopenaei]AVO37370.1 hypothetical protein C6Y53_06365 [Pukyongiella litopenaei]
MNTVIAFAFRNRFGLWSIRYTGRFWRVALNDQPFGDYISAAGAHEDLVRGYCFTAPGGLDPAECGLPEDLSEWEPVHQR